MRSWWIRTLRRFMDLPALEDETPVVVSPMSVDPMTEAATMAVIVHLAAENSNEPS